MVHNRVDRRVSADHWARRTRATLLYLELADISMEFRTVSAPNWGCLSETLLRRHLPSKKVLPRPVALSWIPKRGRAEWCSLTKMESTYHAWTKPISRQNACPHHKQLNAQMTQIADPETLQMLIDMELEKGSWEAVSAHASATIITTMRLRLTRMQW